MNRLKIEEKIINYNSNNPKKYNGSYQWFLDKGLRGLITLGPFRKKGSPITVLKWFDERYSKKRKQESWFNQEKNIYITFKTRGKFEDLYVVNNRTS